MGYPSPSLTDDLSVPPTEGVSWNESLYFGSIDSFDWSLPQVFSPTQTKELQSQPRLSDSEYSSRICSYLNERSEAQSHVPAGGMSIDSTLHPAAARKVSPSGNTRSLRNDKGDLFVSGQICVIESSKKEDPMFDATEHAHTDRSLTWRTTQDAPEIKCRFTKCERQNFNTSSELRNHMDTHHKCNIPGCTQTDLFTAKGQLDRHKRCVHGAGSTKLFYCETPGCDRGPSGRGFARKDHLLQHSRSHGERRQRSSHRQVRAMRELQVPSVHGNSSTDVVASRKRKRPASDTSSVLNDPEGKSRPKKHILNAGALAMENEELTAEVARLKGVIARLAGAVTQLSKE